MDYRIDAIMPVNMLTGVGPIDNVREVGDVINRMNINKAKIDKDNIPKVKELTEKEDKALKKACQDFEAIFLSIMYKEMKKTVPEDSFVEKSNGTKIFEDMYMDTLAEENSKVSSLGIAKMLYDSFKQGRVE